MALLIPVTTFADHRYYRDYPRRGYEHEHRKSNPWPFIAGVVVGGIVVREIDRQRQRDELTYITVCEEYVVYDQWGHYIYDERGGIVTQRRCRQELVRVGRD